ncbi:MAG: putative repeat protein (TIGR03806 family) [Kiritimatiellia bacterium]
MIRHHVAWAGLLVGCGGLASVEVPLTRRPPSDLAAFNLFEWEDGEVRYNDELVEYEMNTPLFTDFTLKSRALYLPAGQRVTFEDEAAFEFPVGSVVVKNFILAPDLREPTVDPLLIETRLMIRYEEGWQAWPYLWDEAGESASLKLGGDIQEHSFIDAKGEPRDITYLIPQRSQCQECHEVKSEDDEDHLIVLLGPKARHLNLDHDYGDGPVNQLQHLADLGLMADVPDLDSVDRAFDFSRIERDGFDGLSADEINHAARSYLDINCAHCHNPQGVQGISSQLFLNHDNEDRFRLGVCKKPGSAGEGTGGFVYDIVPGNPDESILVYRLVTDDVGAMMPLLGRSLIHDEGVELVRRWIAQMPADDCK